MMAQIRTAATVLLLRDIPSEQAMEVFMVRRAVQSEFMPDVYVFPGGSVSPDDYRVEEAAGFCRSVTLSIVDPEGRTASGSGIRAAAIRELFEEANVLLAYHGDTILAINATNSARFAEYRRAFNTGMGSLLAMAQSEQLVLATDQLAYFAHWITPEGLPKRYDTHFFLAHAPDFQETVYDPRETSAGIWIQPAIAIERCQQASFPLAFPTFQQLRLLSAFHSVAEAFASVTNHYVTTSLPILEQQQGRAYVYLPADPAHRWQL